MPVSLEMQVRIAELRQKARDGTMTLEDSKEAIAFLRQERMAMPPTKSSGAKTKAPQANVDDMLGELGI